jgi:hypothetical protein
MNVETSIPPSWFSLISTHTSTLTQIKLIPVLANKEVRDVVVEIESTCIRKPFLGGYRHKASGTEYHHAFTQTPSLYSSVSAEGN